MYPKGPLIVFICSLAYLLITIFFHFKDSPRLQHSQNPLHAIHGEKEVVTFSNQSLQSSTRREEKQRHEPESDSVMGKPGSGGFDRPGRHDPVSSHIREHWMRQANAALEMLSSPCPLFPFGSVIVNHTEADGIGDLVCIGANGVGKGNPTLHGEIAAINNCSSVLTAPNGRFRLSNEEALEAFKSLSLYTNGEPCSMCASAIRWAGFKECIYGTSIKTLVSQGWDQIRLSSHELFDRASHLPGETRLVGDILTNETNPYFAWQFDASRPCPVGCTREFSGMCEPVWALLEQ